jgi:predicted nucleic acid-binding protein
MTPDAGQEAIRTCVLDTNVLLRFITGLPQEHFNAATELFARCERGEIRLVLTSVITAETVYVLQSFYGVGRADIAKSLSSIVGSGRIRVAERSILMKALNHYGRTNLAFADCYIAGCAIENGQSVVTFDRGLKKLPELDVVEPPGL